MTAIFSKCHYEFIAAELRRTRYSVNSGAPLGTFLHVVDRLATKFAEENPTFDRARFIEAAVGNVTHNETSN